jgi:hypothetical protein
VVNTSEAETEPIFRRLWDMLINRCPDLRSLSLTTDGVGEVEPVDVRHICHGRWPNLRHLKLGNVAVAWQPNAPDDRTPFITFLDEHKSLERLDFGKHFNVPHEHLDEFATVSLPKLVDFTGSVGHLQALPRKLSLRSIRICETLVVRELTPMTISNILQAISSLVTLEVSFILQSGYDSVSVLRSIISSCPQLRHLDLTCCHKPSFSLVSFFSMLLDLVTCICSFFAGQQPGGIRARVTCIAQVANFQPHARQGIR